jgi:hypothetical protein
MIDRRQSWMNGIRAAVGAMLLLFSALATPVSLTSSETEFCSMECCVAEGHCCCAARKPWVEGQQPDGRPVIAQTQIFSQCPYLCAPSSITSHNLRVVERPVAHARAPAAKPPASDCDSTPIQNSSWFVPISPRAPPPFD